MPKQKLVKSKTYSVTLYPQSERVIGFYVGSFDAVGVKSHVFEADKSYVLVGDREMSLKGDNVSHKSIFAVGVAKMEKETWADYPQIDEKISKTVEGYYNLTPKNPILHTLDLLFVPSSFRRNTKERTRTESPGKNRENEPARVRFDYILESARLLAYAGVTAYNIFK